MTPPRSLDDLAEMSARIGRDPLLIQAAGGNTSVKDGDVMWIKASGTQLRESTERQIFVPVCLRRISTALSDPALDADDTASFALGESQLRPSIETSLHAAFSQAVVVHVHCVNTLAWAVRQDGAEVLASKLADFEWAWVPYCKPGAHLAREVAVRLDTKTNVVVLQNHGLIIAAETVAAAQTILTNVVSSLRVEPDELVPPDLSRLAQLADEVWVAPPPLELIHQIALAPGRVGQAASGSLYPDHVIFCGVATAVFTDTLPKRTDEAAPKILIVPGAGVLVRDWNPSTRALARCLAEVLLRVPSDAPLSYLTNRQNAELLNWDAEKYRRSLNE